LYASKGTPIGEPVVPEKSSKSPPDETELPMPAKE
jgi:hypothetical protein